MKYILMHMLLCLAIVIPSTACEKSGKRKSEERDEPAAEGMKLRNRKLMQKDSRLDQHAFVKRLFGTTQATAQSSFCC